MEVGLVSTTIYFNCIPSKIYCYILLNNMSDDFFETNYITFFIHQSIYLALLKRKIKMKNKYPTANYIIIQ